MNELVRITENNGKSLVEARELHQFLESKQEFVNWIKKRIDEYGFVEGQDFTSFDKIIKREKGATTLKEYSLSLDMAKELAMVERSDKGRKARQYFIEVEKRYRAALEHPALVQMKQLFDDFQCNVRCVNINYEPMYNVEDLLRFFGYSPRTQSRIRYLWTCFYAHKNDVGELAEAYISESDFVLYAATSAKPEVQLIANMLKGGVV